MGRLYPESVAIADLCGEARLQGDKASEAQIGGPEEESHTTGGILYNPISDIPDESDEEFTARILKRQAREVDETWTDRGEAREVPDALEISDPEMQCRREKAEFGSR
jgi:hypothetical protein